MRLSQMLCATAGLLVMGATAFAQSFPVTYNLNSNALVFTLNYLKGDGTHTSENGSAGPFTATVTGQTPFTVYCVDLEDNVHNPQTVTAVAIPTSGPGMGPNDHYDNTPGTYGDLANAAYLFNKYAAGVGNDTTLGAALQLAIWDVVDGHTDYSVLTGDFSVSNYNNMSTTLFNTVVADANAYLADLQYALQHNSGTDNGTLYSAVVRGSGQDMLGGSDGPRNPNAVTPEGSSLLLLLPGLIPVAVGLRRRRLNTPVGE